MGMMSWAILPLCYLAKQLEAQGSVANSMAVSVALMELYVFKFFLWVFPTEGPRLSREQTHNATYRLE